MVVRRLYNLAERGAQNRYVLPVAVVVLVLSVVLLIAVLPNGSHNPSGSDNSTVNITEDFPSEEPIPDTYSVPDGEPLQVEIANAGIKGYIQKVGIDQHQAVAAPNNINLAGWFVDSMLPGQKGLSIIDGHVSGRTADGVFKNLRSVNLGDEVVVTMGSGDTFVYEVIETFVVPNEQAANILFDQRSNAINGQLNLITCTGQYDPSTNTYADRVIVYSALK